MAVPTEESKLRLTENEGGILDNGNRLGRRRWQDWWKIGKWKAEPVSEQTRLITGIRFHRLQNEITSIRFNLCITQPGLFNV